MSTQDFYKLKAEIREYFDAQPLENPCWEGYEAIGFKKKNGKKVPNCVPKKKK